MKRISNLYDEIISIANLQLAERNARRGKTHQKGVMLFDKDKDGNLQRLHEMLKNETFTTSPYIIFKVFEPKERIIYRLPYFHDRIIHHAVMILLEPIWCKIFTYNTYSCINGRGITACAKQVVKIIRSFEGSPLYCLKIDIRKFYPSVDNEILKAIVRRKIKESDFCGCLIISSTAQRGCQSAIICLSIFLICTSAILCTGAMKC